MTDTDGRGDDFEAPRARPYATTNGRTDPLIRLDLAAQVLATGTLDVDKLRFEHACALGLCEAPISVAEVAARLSQPVVVARVLLSDLIEIGAVSSRQVPDGPPEIPFLERVLNGLRSL
jgi:hypothetical protein